MNGIRFTLNRNHSVAAHALRAHDTGTRRLCFHDTAACTATTTLHCIALHYMHRIIILCTPTSGSPRALYANKCHDAQRNIMSDLHLLVPQPAAICYGYTAQAVCTPNQGHPRRHQRVSAHDFAVSKYVAFQKGQLLLNAVLDTRCVKSLHE